MTTILILFFIILCVIFFIHKRIQFASSFPPGPLGLPILGNVLQFDKFDGRKTFVEWHKKHGPLFTIWIGVKPVVLVTGYELMQELFVKRADQFSGRPKSLLFQYFTKGNYGIFQANGSLWHEQRRFTLQTLRNFGFGRKIMEDKILSEIEHFIDSIEQHLIQFKDKNLNIKSLLNVCLGNIISSVMVGHRYTNDDPTFVRLNETLEKFFKDLGSLKVQLLNSFTFLQYVPLFNHFGFDDLKMINKNLIEILNDELENHKRNFVGGTEQPTDFTSAYLQEISRRKASNEDLGHFDEWQLICIIGDVWKAGMETTLTTMLWAVLLMLHHPDVQVKVQAEIDLVVGRNRLPNMNDRSKMPYTIAVIHEFQRFANVLTSNIPHAVTETVVVSGYTIPKDTIIIPQISALLFDDEVFDKAHEFRPERFLDGELKIVQGTEKLLPFSLGKRACLGESLARMELFLIFTSLLQKYTVSFVDDEPKAELKGKAGLTIGPFAYEIKISERNFSK